jgi:SPP1 gp7 family putative phage head morphogenesis protein
MPSNRDNYPTQQQANIKAAVRAISHRMRNAESDVLAILDAIPVSSIKVNQLANNELFYRYELSATRWLQTEQDIKDIIARWLEVQDQTGKPARWFFDPFIDKSYESGTKASLTQISSALSAVITDDNPLGMSLLTQLDYENVLMQPQYRDRIALVAARTFNDMVGFADSNGLKLAQILAAGMAGGKSPAIISRQMQDEFASVQGWRALRIARTEINTAHNQAKYDQDIDARDRLGIEIKEMHISALTETTRIHHAERHGLLFTPEAQKAWWETGGNRINCYCSVVTIVLIDGVPVQKSLIKKTRAKGQKYLGIERKYDDGINPDD